MDLIITDFIKYLSFELNFEGLERLSTKEMEAVGLPKGMDVKVGHGWVLMAGRAKSKVGLRSPGLCLELPSRRLWSLISSSANQA